MSDTKAKAEWKTKANLITIVRIVLVPVFVAVLLAPWPEWFYGPGMPIEGTQYITAAIKPWVAAIVYAVLACTDGIDGYVARKNNEVTTLGKFLDPLADKILVSAALLALIELGDLPSWPVIIIIAREFIVSGLRMLAATEGVVIAARMSGKVKTALTMVAIFMFIVKRSSLIAGAGEGFYIFFYCLSWAVMAAALVATILSMIQYSKQVIKLMNEASKHVSETAVDELAASVLDRARALGVHLACAESCTGGLIGARLTEVPGSSDAFEGGVISYAYDVKETALGVSHETLGEVGAVSREVAIQMAQGARERLLGGFDDEHAVAVSATGVAGPGGSESKPAGTVWIGIAGRGEADARLFHLDGNRRDVRGQTVRAALSMVLERLA